MYPMDYFIYWLRTKKKTFYNILIRIAWYSIVLLLIGFSPNLNGSKKDYYFSLNDEEAEFVVLKTIPCQPVNISLLGVEVSWKHAKSILAGLGAWLKSNYAGDIFPGTRAVIQELLRASSRRVLEIFVRVRSNLAQYDVDCW